MTMPEQPVYAPEEGLAPFAGNTITEVYNTLKRFFENKKDATVLHVSPSSGLQNILSRMNRLFLLKRLRTPCAASLINQNENSSNSITGIGFRALEDLFTKLISLKTREKLSAKN